jgi:hypothetical protein
LPTTVLLSPNDDPTKSQLASGILYIFLTFNSCSDPFVPPSLS